ncbi:MAG: hypothetical protein JWM80_3570, partial [Cyanobacteria bacterium RYN_339]|nr:hypothetical protein [Cyanobacteria bacterium RYN_339]
MTINNNYAGGGLSYDDALRQINAMGPTPAGGAVAPVAPAPVQDKNTAGLEALGQRIGTDYQKLDAALQKGDVAEARRLTGELKQLADEGAKLAAGTTYADSFAQVQAAVAQLEPQLPKDKQMMMV